MNPPGPNHAVRTRARFLTRLAGCLCLLAATVSLRAAELHDAVLFHDLERVKQLLLANPKSVNQTNHNGDTPLYIAAFRGYRQMVELLLQRGANPNPAPNLRGETPLSIARELNLRQTSDLLRKAGAREDDRSRAAEMRYLVQRKDAEMLAPRLKATPQLANATNAVGQTTLHLAAVSGDPALVQLLLDHGAKLDAKTVVGATAYDIAVEREYPELIALLRSRGIKESQFTASAPLRIAARKNLPREAGEFLQAHPELVNVPNDLQRTALMEACGRGSVALVELLLKHGADPRLRDFAEATPLHEASAGGFREIIRLLLDHKADVNASSRSKVTPLHLAALRAHEEIVEQLLAAGADPKLPDNLGQTALHRAAIGGSVAILKRLRGLGLEATTPDKQGNTPLHLAAQRGKPEVVQWLLSQKADPQLRNLAGETPRAIAEKRNHAAVVELLPEPAAKK